MHTALRMTLVLTTTFALSACAANVTQVVDGTQKVSDKAYTEVNKLTEKLRRITTYQPKPTQGKPVPPLYCYRVVQDIACYSQAVPGAESRLVAYQGSVVEEDGAVMNTDRAYQAVPVQPVQETARMDDVAPHVELRPISGMSGTGYAPAQAESTFIGSGPEVKASTTPTPEAPAK